MVLIDTLRETADPRRGNAQRHELLDIMAIALVGSVCGAESYVGFTDFAEDRETLLREILILKWCRVTTSSVASSICSTLPPSGGRSGPSAPISARGGRRVLAIDGRTLRRSFDRAAERSPLHVVTAFGSGARVAIAQRAVAPPDPQPAQQGPAQSVRRPQAKTSRMVRRLRKNYHRPKCDSPTRGAKAFSVPA